jgi:hypothetical protein
VQLPLDQGAEAETKAQSEIKRRSMTRRGQQQHLLLLSANKTLNSPASTTCSGTKVIGIITTTMKK